MGRGSPRFERGGGRAQTSQAHTREGSADLGAGGMGQGGQEEGPLAKAYAAARVGGFAEEEEVGGGADLLLAWPEQEDEQGLRALVRERRSVRLRGHDLTDGEASGSCLRLSRQFLHALLG